jgi:hypothetical protein
MPTRPIARKPGRPHHVPDEKGCRRVTAWSGGGIDQEMIALSLNISRLTLRKHYSVELRTGKAMMDGLGDQRVGGGDAAGRQGSSDRGEVVDASAHGVDRSVYCGRWQACGHADARRYRAGRRSGARGGRVHRPTDHTGRLRGRPARPACRLSNSQHL